MQEKARLELLVQGMESGTGAAGESQDQLLLRQQREAELLQRIASEREREEKQFVMAKTIEFPFEEQRELIAMEVRLEMLRYRHDH